MKPDDDVDLRELLDEVVNDEAVRISKEQERGEVGPNGLRTGDVRGERAGRKGLTTREALEVKILYAINQFFRRLLRNGLSIDSIAEEYKVATSTVRSVGKGKGWAHLPEVEYAGPSVDELVNDGRVRLVTPEGEEEAVPVEEECDACRMFGVEACRIHGKGGWS